MKTVKQEADHPTLLLAYHKQFFIPREAASRKFPAALANSAGVLPSCEHGCLRAVHINHINSTAFLAVGSAPEARSLSHSAVLLTAAYNQR